ncbi:MAG: D-tyrosyl-tRNA(Tyr) deacylase [Deltaproteobacteria bacterium]|nr:D-tyrosyl-tRNA(Tyr) deacylase [Deltaproteobacteria bacterium]
MRAVVQRVGEARVEVAGEVVGRIGHGMLVLLGVGRDDDEAAAKQLATRIAQLRIFDDERGRMNLALAEVGGAMLVVSQFTLWGDTDAGRRPSWSRAAPGAQAEPLYRTFVEHLRALGIEVAEGRFGADMDVHLVNRGPVTLLLGTDA